MPAGLTCGSGCGGLLPDGVPWLRLAVPMHCQRRALVHPFTEREALSAKQEVRTCATDDERDRGHRQQFHRVINCQPHSERNGEGYEEQQAAQSGVGPELFHRATVGDQGAIWTFYYYFL